MDRMNPAEAASAQIAPECQVELDHQTDIGLPPPPPSAQERLTRLVRTIESDLIPRLIRAHRGAADVGEPVESAGPPEAAEIERFVTEVLADDDHGWQTMIEQFRQRNMAVSSIYLDLLSPAAHRLGEQWSEDLISFADVTVAVGRLQRIMRGLSPLFDTEVDVLADGRRALLIPAPGEQHTFGLSMVAEFFRRSGWEVVGGSGPESLDPVRAVRDEWFDVVGISVGVEARLEWLRSGVSALRRASRNKGIGVMVGGPIFVQRPERVSEVGADATARDGSEAPKVAERLLELRARRL